MTEVQSGDRGPALSITFDALSSFRLDDTEFKHWTLWTGGFNSYDFPLGLPHESSHPSWKLREIIKLALAGGALRVDPRVHLSIRPDDSPPDLLGYFVVLENIHGPQQAIQLTTRRIEFTPTPASLSRTEAVRTYLAQVCTTANELINPGQAHSSPVDLKETNA